MIAINILNFWWSNLNWYKLAELLFKNCTTVQVSRAYFMLLSQIMFIEFAD